MIRFSDDYFLSFTIEEDRYLILWVKSIYSIKNHFRLAIRLNDLTYGYEALIIQDALDRIYALYKEKNNVA